MRFLGLFFGVCAGILFIFWDMPQDMNEYASEFYRFVVSFMLFLLLVEVAKKDIFILGAGVSVVGIAYSIPNMAEIAVPFILASIYVVFVLVDWMEHSSWYIEMQKNGDLLEGGELD